MRTRCRNIECEGKGFGCGNSGVAKDDADGSLDGAEMGMGGVASEEFRLPIRVVFLEPPRNLDEVGWRGRCRRDG